MRKIVLPLILLLTTLPTLALKPEKAYKMTPDSLGIAYKEHYV